MAETPDLLIDEAEVARRVEEAAARLAPMIDDDSVLVCLLTGGLWFAADLTRALYRLGKSPLFDALWLASYGDAKSSSGRVQVVAGLQRPLAGRKVVLIDDVLDSGQSLEAARRLVLDAGATEALTCVFARKPWPHPRVVDPEVVAWEAPGRFLAGYGMDVAGRMRGVPDILALD
jgi:hypoxanthine phosphoribosyltransferase